MKAQWTDVTSYAQSEPRGTVTPRSWEINLAWLRVTVTRMHQLDGWYLRAHDIGINALQLKSVRVDAAQREALRFVRKRLAEAKTAADKACKRQGLTIL